MTRRIGLSDFTGMEIVDISQPINAKTAVFPGDVPFSRDITVSCEQSGVLNLTAFTMSPHVGTHADAPAHIAGSLDQHTHPVAADLPLAPYLGPAVVIDVSPCSEAITPQHIREKLAQYDFFPQRVLFKTRTDLRYDVFENDYAWLSSALIRYLSEKGAVLVGLDTPSVDPVNSKALETHHTLLETGMTWLENLDLASVSEGCYILIALPLKFTELEASPLRAVLLKPHQRADG